MMLDSSYIHATIADETIKSPKGIPPYGQENKPCPKGKKQPRARIYRQELKAAVNEEDWCYLNLFPDEVNALETRIYTLRGMFTEGVVYTEVHDKSKGKDIPLYIPPIFVHRSMRYVPKNGERSESLRRRDYREKQGVATISGLVFLQGTSKQVKRFLEYFFPYYHIANDCARQDEADRTATIGNDRMQAFIKAVHSNPARVRLINCLLEDIAKDKPLVEMTTGEFAGQQGYIVRMSRDRKLVFRLTKGITICISDIHKDEFEKVEEPKGK